MKKLILSLAVAILSLPLFAQQDSAFDLSRLEFGGIFGFGFSKNSSALTINPQVGYRVNDYFSVGGGPSYSYYKWSDNYTENYAGLTFYARVRPVQYIQLLVHPEFYRTWGNTYDDRFVPCLLVGGGVIVPLSNTFGFTGSLAYDIVQNEASPYRNRMVYSLGVTFGF